MYAPVAKLHVILLTAVLDYDLRYIEGSWAMSGNCKQLGWVHRCIRRAKGAADCIMNYALIPSWFHVDVNFVTTLYVHCIYFVYLHMRARAFFESVF